MKAVFRKITGELDTIKMKIAGNIHEEKYTLKQAQIVGVVGIGEVSSVEKRLKPTVIEVVARVKKL